MDREYIKELEEKCIQDCPPGCQSLCPLHLDVRNMIRAVQEGDFAAALSVYMKSVPFPGILSGICDAPCRSGCMRSGLGGAVEIRGLEAAAVRYGGRRERKVRILRKRSETVAVVGGGLSGLSAALFLNEKGYRVRLFEKSGSLGGRVLGYIGRGVTEEGLRSDLKVLEKDGIEISLGSPIAGGEFQKLRESFPAVLVTAGSDAGGSICSGLRPDPELFTNRTSGSLRCRQHPPAGIFACSLDLRRKAGRRLG